MKRCRECSVALIPEDFVFERAVGDGRVLRERVSGHRCPSCGERVLAGRDAERISRRWYELLGSSADAESATATPASSPVRPTPR